MTKKQRTIGYLADGIADTIVTAYLENDLRLDSWSEDFEIERGVITAHVDSCGTVSVTLWRDNPALTDDSKYPNAAAAIARELNRRNLYGEARVKDAEAAADYDYLHYYCRPGIDW